MLHIYKNPDALYGDYTDYTDYTHVWCTRTQCCIRRLENPRKIFTAVKTVDVCCRVVSGLRSTKVKDKFSNPRWVLLSSFLAYVHTGKTGLEQWKVKIWSSLSAPRNPRTFFHCQAGPFSDDVCFHFFVSLCHQPGPDLPESKTDDDEEDNDKDDDVDI